jgi:hypothetical protein
LPGICQLAAKIQAADELIDFADGSASFPKALRQWRLALHSEKSLTPNARGIRRRQNKYSVPPSISMGHRILRIPLARTFGKLQGNADRLYREARIDSGLKEFL